jgi:uncharacterized membrane protein
MKPLLILLIVFIISIIIAKVACGNYNFALSGRISLAAMLVFTAIGHFAFNKGMSLMVPDPIPFKAELIYLTGVLEILFAASLFFPAYRISAGWLIIAFLLLVLPFNIYASLKHIDYQKATFDGNGIGYLWFRIPLQVLFILWTYFSAIKY